MSDADPLVDWGLAIAQSPLLAQGMAFMSLLVETVFPLALVSRRAALRILGSWTSLAAVVRSAWPARGRSAMLYDGSCGVCRRTVEIVQRLDVLGRVDVLDAADDWPSIERRYHGLSQMACLEEMHVLTPDGRAERGFDAYRVLARALPITWVLVPFLYAPGVRRVGQSVYRSVAHRRFRQGCALAAPPAPASSNRSRAS